jgi:PAS domain-containing protein
MFNEESLKRGRKESEQRRRVLMNQYYDELVILLSMISERTIPKKMDKASTLHEAVRCLRTYAELTPPGKIPLLKPRGKSKKGGSNVAKNLGIDGLYSPLISSGEALQSFLDAHDTFLILVSDSGHIMYATELITALLGHMQTRLVGQNIFDYILKSEKPALLDMFDPGDATPSLLTPPNGKVLSYPVRSLHCHFKLYTGETGSLTQHLPFMCLSYLRRWKDTEEPGSPPMSPFMDLNNSGGGGESECFPLPGDGGLVNTRQQSYVILLGKLPTNLTLLDLPLGVNDVNFSFDLRVSKNGNIINIDSHAVLVLGFTISEIVGSHFFDYIDPYHLLEVGEHMGDIFSNTRGSTNPYRFQTKGGRYVWLLSKGYLSYNPWNHKPDHILLSSRVLGCDHVVPEFRFFRSRSLLPDVGGGDDLYDPPPLSQKAPSPPKSPPHSLWQTSITAPLFDSPSILSPLLQGDSLSGGSASIPQQQQQQQQHVKPESVSATASTRQCSVQPGGRGVGKAPLNTTQAEQTREAPSVNPPPPQIQEQSRDQSQQQQGQNMGVDLPPNLLIDFQQEMVKKNNELFDMQRRLLEQQMLMERERNQFYNVAQQVMQCIGTSGGSALPPNLRSSGFAMQTDHTRSQSDNSQNATPDPYSFLSQNKPSATVAQPVPSSEGFPQQFPTTSSEANPLTVLMESRKPTGIDSSPYSMFHSQSSVGMLGQGNPLGQQPQWQTGSVPPSASTSAQQHQQAPKQSGSHPNKLTASSSVDNNPYTMLLGQSPGGLRGSINSAGSIPQQHHWPLSMPDLIQQQQQSQVSVMGQGWGGHTQEHHLQRQDKSAGMAAESRRSNAASNPPYTLPSAEQLMGGVGQSSSGQFQQRGWPPTAQQHGWPANATSAQQDPQWPGKAGPPSQRQKQQPQKPKSGASTTGDANSPYSMLLQGGGGFISQQQNWGGSVPASSNGSQQQQPNHHSNTMQGNQQSRPPASCPPSSTTTSTLLQTPFSGLASQLKMTSFTPNLPSSNLNPSSSQTSPQHSQQSDSLPMRLPSDEEIQNLLDNIQMKCSSTSIPGLDPPDYP